MTKDRHTKARLIIDFLRESDKEEFKQAVIERTGSERGMTYVLREFCKQYVREWKKGK